MGHPEMDPNILQSQSRDSQQGIQAMAPTLNSKHQSLKQLKLDSIPLCSWWLLAGNKSTGKRTDNFSLCTGVAAAGRSDFAEVVKHVAPFWVPVMTRRLIYNVQKRPSCRQPPICKAKKGFAPAVELVGQCQHIYGNKAQWPRTSLISPEEKADFSYPGSSLSTAH